MVPVVALAIAAALGLSSIRMAVLATAIYQPIPLALAVGFLSWRERSGTDTRPAMFCETLSAELRAGGTLRQSVESAAEAVGLHEVALDTPMAQLASDIGQEFAEIGTELELTIKSASRAGNDAAVLFDEIGSFALAKAEIASEVRIATTPGIATALVLVGAPLVFVVLQAQSGVLAASLASPEQRVAALVGLGLFGFGVVIAFLVVWWSRR